ncbi:MAG TPA: hypothetical protein VFQ01_11865 [Nocardioides sp.]|nr:hypothetical protein [Nocardioides sp.]
MTDNPTSDAAERYGQTLTQMADLVGEEGHTDAGRRWDRLVEQLAEHRRVLQESPEGREAIAGHLHDARPTARLWSAAAVLFWDDAAARSVLVEIREEPLRYGLHSIMAKHTLLDYDAGRLTPDATLPGSPGSPAT